MNLITTIIEITKLALNGILKVFSKISPPQNRTRYNDVLSLWRNARKVDIYTDPEFAMSHDEWHKWISHTSLSAYLLLSVGKGQRKAWEMFARYTTPPLSRQSKWKFFSLFNGRFTIVSNILEAYIRSFVSIIFPN